MSNDGLIRVAVWGILAFTFIGLFFWLPSAYRRIQRRRRGQEDTAGEEQD